MRFERLAPAAVLFLSSCVAGLDTAADPTESEPAADDPLPPPPVGTPAHEVAFQLPNRDLRQQPPVVKSMEMLPADDVGGQPMVRLEVRYAERLPAQLQFFDGDTVHTLRDDGAMPDRLAGDGVYTTLLARSSPLLATDPPAGNQFTGKDPVLAVSEFPFNVDPEKALLVRDLSVVNDPTRTKDACLSTSSSDGDKKWSFGHLIKGAANESKTGISPSKFATEWLKQWMKKNLTVNGDVVEPIKTDLSKRKVAGEVLRQWRCKSGADKCCKVMPVDGDGDINTGSTTWKACDSQASTKPLLMNKAPFRLMAIVNRVDLRHNMFFGEGTAGELRFVFEVLDLEMRERTGGPCAGLGGVALNRGASPSPSEQSGLSTVILEYAVDKKTPTDVKAWAKSWFDLDGLALGSSTYLTNLQNITESVVKAGAGAVTSRANSSALIRIRTNESNDDVFWQLREFAIDKTAKVPRAQTIKQTPSRRYADQNSGLVGADSFGDELEGWISDNQDAVLSDAYKVPASAFGQPLLGGETSHRIGEGFWAAGAIDFGGLFIDPEARHKFSLNTCSGCHGGETQTAFAHIEPRLSSERAPLSGFLTGIASPVFPDVPFTVTDPIFPDIVRTFSDLDRRNDDMADLLGQPLMNQLAFQPLARTH